MGPFLLIVRLVVLACGVGIVLAVYQIAIKVYNSRPSALAAASITAVLAPMIVSSQVIKCDLPGTLLMLWSIQAYLSTQSTSRLRPLILASLLAGAAMGAHYYGVVLVPTYLVMEALRCRMAHVEYRTCAVRCALVVSLF